MNSTGKKGENLAAFYLRLHGYAIEARNFRSRFGEIDIVARKGKTTVFVEVKARGGNTVAPAATFVDERKQKKIIKTASYYILNSGREETDFRFDVIAIERKRWRFRLRHIINAFEIEAMV